MSATDTPLWQQIARTVTEKIDTGRTPAGSAAPTPDDIVNEWGVNVDTARKALAELYAAGVIRLRPDNDPIVDGTNPRSGTGRATTVMRGGTMHREPSTILSAAVVSAPALIAAKMGVAEGTDVVRRERLSRIGGQPVAYGCSWMPMEIAELVPEALATVPVPRGAPFVATEKLGTTVATVREHVDAFSCPSDAAELLSVEPGSPVVTATCWWHDSEGRLLEVGEELRTPGRPNTYRLRIS